MKRYWLVKQEPAAYSWDKFVQDGGTAWTGVRNWQARRNLKEMRKNDLALFYHSVTDKAVVGIAKVKREAYPDPTATEGDWLCVDLVPVRPLKEPVTLSAIKKNPKLKNLPLVKQPRLSVMPVSKEQFEAIVATHAEK